MKSKLTKISVVVFLFLIFCMSPMQAKEPMISAKAAIVMDCDTGQILWGKSAFKRMYPASTTKILTAIIGLEMGQLNEIITVSKNAAAVGEASIYLKENHRLLLEDLVKGALIKSGNDAAYAIGEGIAGSESLFLALMNKKATLIGAKTSNFKNTNGLPDPEHISSAYDLAIIARYCMSNKSFAGIVAKKEEQIKILPDENRFLKNTNKLLLNYPFATGIKTGTTVAAGQCLIASANKNGKCIITVVLRSFNRYNDTISLLDFAFSDDCNR